MTKVAIDCEMVGDHNDLPMLAKITLVDSSLGVIYDTFVKPTKPVGSYRETGFGSQELNNGKPFSQVQNEVRNNIRGNILVGHSVDADLKALDLTHYPVKDIADHYKKYNQRQSLANLSLELLGERIQTGRFHDSVEDAITAMKIYNKKPF